METGIENLEDVQTNEHKIEMVEEEKYLGTIISVDGSNLKDIEAKADKAQGILKQVKSMLEEMCFGNFLFEVAMVFRNSFLINGILTNLEASYGLTLDQIEKLERCDEQLIRTVLECP